MCVQTYIEGRERDWGNLPADQLVQVEAGELQALLRHARDKIDLITERQAGKPGMPRAPIVRSTAAHLRVDDDLEQGAAPGFG